jgi:hypothetical protein
MNRHENTFLVLALTGLLLLAFSGSLFAGSANPPKPAGPGLRAFWLTGIVSKAPWVDADQRHCMAVNDDEYIFVSEDVRPLRHFKDSAGIWQEEPLSFSDIREGENVMVLVAGPHIYGLIVVEQY